MIIQILTNAGGNDITLVTTRLRFLPGTIEQNIEFSLSVDNIAQELDETFAITLEVPDGIFGPGANIRNRLEGVIIDSDGRLNIFIKVLAIQQFLSLLQQKLPFNFLKMITPRMKNLMHCWKC